METKSICEELLSIAENELKKIERILPQDPLGCSVLFIETIRMYDIYTANNANISWDSDTSIQQLDIIKTGWNLAAHYLLKTLPSGGFPLTVSTEETRSNARNLLYMLGGIITLRRAVDMVNHGFLLVEKIDNTYNFKKTQITDDQFLDVLEFSYLENFDETIKSSTEIEYEGWALKDMSSISDDFYKEGNFLFFNKKHEFEKYLLNDLESKMTPLIKPWNTGRVIMMGYGSTPEIDNHFTASATILVDNWRSEAGLHPSAQIGNVKGAELSAIVILLASLHLKHLAFSNFASKNNPEISIFQSLTIWEPLNKIINDLTEYTGFKREIVSETINAVMLKPKDVEMFKEHTTRFMPLLIDLGNGYVLRPLSSIVQNPFYSIIPLLEHRTPTIKDQISYHREDWIRSHLYAMFSGTRYQTIKGNVNLRENKKIITDIDAAVFDNITGELAIFQIKWQDFYFNNVSKLRSRAKNLTESLDTWTDKTSLWIESHGYAELMTNLRIKPTKQKTITSVYLFAISRNKARMSGYGYNIKSKNLAITNWPQFLKNRQKIGPVERVISSLFNTLKSQEKDIIISTPRPVKIQILDTIINFEDLWSSVED